MTDDNGDPRRRLLPLHPARLGQARAGGRLELLAVEGRSPGAARFEGLEGALWSKGSVYFVASEAGDTEKGQIWRYTPHGTKSGKLTLLDESKSGQVLDQPDGLTRASSISRKDVRDHRPVGPGLALAPAPR